ncbi:MAG: crossover junction endodeoxyribonuclease RuvC [Thermoleophilia bacterium]|nr:crossover junction endodeoxyribonuclease RuvC [Thermoleophilia bacterium]
MILGIDPGLASTGYAVLTKDGTRLRGIADGTLTTSPRMDQPERLKLLFDGVRAVAEEHQVQSAAIEAWFVHPAATSTMGTAEARGAIQVALAGAGLTVTEYTPTSIKQSVAGYGGADKAQVHAMVRRLCGRDCSSNHAADAMAVAICHATSAPLRQAIRRAK